MDTRQPSPRPSYFLVAACILVIVVVGFTRTFYLRGVFEGDALPGYLYLHGAVLTGWFAVFFFYVETITGLILMLFYAPTPERAYGDMLNILGNVPFGLFMRDLHRIGAEGMVAVVILLVRPRGLMGKD